MKRAFRVAALAWGGFLIFLGPLPTVACSPPFEPTIRALGPDQMIIVGTCLRTSRPLQADPSSEEGQRYLAEAAALFGAGVVPPPAEVMPTPLPASDSSALFALAGGAVAVGLATVLVLRSRGSRARA